MIPVKTNMTEVDRLPGEEIKFSISEANAGWVMRSMADLYSNRELAVVREYSTNAYDSNKEWALAHGMKTVQPIEVTLPSVMNPYFTVQDFGVGMSEDELKQVYTQFGSSTKRDSNEFNGMLGFGSKSAVAYTNTFTITSVKNGRKTVAVVSRKEDYTITMKIIMTVETTEHNGVTIQVPVHNHEEFKHKALDFYRFWLPGRVKINNKDSKPVIGDEIGPGLYYNTDNTSYVVMGNVPYRIENPAALFRGTGLNQINFVAYVDNGTIEFTPSREDLKYSEHTKAALHKIITDFAAQARAKANTEITAATTHYDAFKAWRKWRDVLGRGAVKDLKFKGDEVIEHINFALQTYHWNMGSYRYNTTYTGQAGLEPLHKGLIVTGFAASRPSAEHKRRVKEWAAKENISINAAWFTMQDKMDSPWIDPNRVVDWERVKKEIPPLKKAKVPKAVAWGRKAGSFDLISHANGREAEQDVPSATPLYYIMVSDLNLMGTGDIRRLLGDFNITEKVVIIPANRLDKFNRNYTASNILDVLRGKIELDGNKLVSEDVKKSSAMSNRVQSTMKSFVPSDFVDPELSELTRIANVDYQSNLGDYRKQQQLSRLLKVHHNFKTVDDIEYPGRASTPNLFNRYPLLNEHLGYYYSRMDANTKRHILFYVNSLYKARKEGVNV